MVAMKQLRGARRLALWSPVALAVAALFGAGCDDGGGGDTSIDAAAADGLTPGAWIYAAYTPTQDSCGSAVDGDGGFTLEVIADGFRIVRSGSNPASTCLTTGADFTCTTPDQVRDLRPSNDAVLTARLSLSGRITTSTLMTGTQGITISCAGTGCANVPGSSCTVTANVTLAKQ